MTSEVKTALRCNEFISTVLSSNASALPPDAKSFVAQPQSHHGANGPRDASTSAESLRRTTVSAAVGAFPQAMASISSSACGSERRAAASRGA
jgi:hypothetical protein